jgi:transposase
METVAKKKSRPRRSFTPEFKAEIVERCRVGDRSVAQVAKDFNLVESAVRRWAEQADIDSGQRDGLTTGEREELRELRRENRRLQGDVDLLKRAMAFMPMTRLCRKRWAGAGIAAGQPWWARLGVSA